MMEEESGVRPLRRWRAELVLSIRELARLADVAPATIYLTEAGRTTPRPASTARRSSIASSPTPARRCSAGERSPPI